MGLPTESPVPTISHGLVAKSFLEQYYGVLHGLPENFYRFFQDSSILSRPDSNGVMKSVTTTQAINDLILSLDCTNYITEILSADSQPSYKDGVFIQVTGCLTGLDKIQRLFSQSFFLAPQIRGGYFVLNDVFRFLGDSQPRQVNQMLSNGVSETRNSPLTPEQVVSVQDLRATTDPLTPPSEGLHGNGEESRDVAENGGSVAEEDVSHVTMHQPVQPSHIDTETVPEMLQPVVQEDLPMKSYASILVTASPMPVYVPTTKARQAPRKPEKHPLPSTTPARAPEITDSSSNSTSQTSDSRKEGHSIFIRNLPLNVTAGQVEEVFKNFGPIKPRGVQVRSHKLERNCFGFVEFETSDSRQVAIEASPVMIGGRQAFIVEKKTMKRDNVVSSGSGTNGRGQYSAGRGGSNGGGFQNDNFRGGRGSSAGNRDGFAANGLRNTRGSSDYSSRGRGLPRGRTSEAYYKPRFVQNGYVRMDRPSTTNQTTAAA